jgi:hypothetical protein
MLGSLFAQKGDSRRAELDVLRAVTGAAQPPFQRPELVDDSACRLELSASADGQDSESGKHQTEEVTR